MLEVFHNPTQCLQGNQLGPRNVEVDKVLILHRTLQQMRYNRCKLQQFQRVGYHKAILG